MWRWSMGSAGAVAPDGARRSGRDRPRRAPDETTLTRLNPPRRRTHAERHRPQGARAEPHEPQEDVRPGEARGTRRLHPGERSTPAARGAAVQERWPRELLEG